MKENKMTNAQAQMTNKYPMSKCLNFVIESFNYLFDIANPRMVGLGPRI